MQETGHSTSKGTTFQLLEVTQATTGHEYILMILDTQQVSTPAVQPTQQHHNR